MTNKKYYLLISILFVGLLSFHLIFTSIIRQKDEKNIQVPGQYLGIFEITFYTHTGNKTSNLVWPKANRTIAVDPKIIPYGSILYVDGFNYYIAEDCGGDIKNKRLDIFVDTYEEAIKLGRQKKKVYLLQNK